MPDEWKRNDAARKGITFHASGLDQSGLARGIIASHDSHGDLDQLAAGCGRVVIAVICNVTCKKCVLNLDPGAIQFPPGTVRLKSDGKTKQCC